MHIIKKDRIAATLLALALIIGTFSFAAPAHAQCMVSYANIGTIGSTTTQDTTYTSITLNNAASFNSSLFPSQSVNIDSYNSLAAQYAQNGDVLPSNYADTNNGYVNTQISVPTAALNTISYQAGDIIIVGPPFDAGCGASGFVAIFGSNGVIKSAISYAADNYTYGSDTLTITQGAPSTDCTSNGGTFSAENICATPLSYSVDGATFILNQAGTKTLSGNFKQVNLVTSTYSTITGGGWIEDFDPTNIVQTITFSGTAPTPPDNSVQALIKSLLLQVQRLQQQLLDLKNGNPNPPTPPTPCNALDSILGNCPTPPHPQCVAITNSLSVDDTDVTTGGDVTRLQTFLAADTSIYPEGMITGYFGPATERAVQRWQARAGIVSSGDPDSTGYGFVGRKTRTAMAASCGTTPPPPLNNFSATPTSGSAPLSVTFLNMVNSGRQQGAISIDFGDGQSAPAANCVAPADGCTTPGRNVHTYASVGTYTATLKKSSAPQDLLDSGCSGDCAAILGVANQASTQVVGTVTITVGGTSSNTLNISVGPTNPLQVTASFSSGVSCSGGYILDWGDGTSPNTMAYTPPPIGSACMALARFNNIQHVYAAGGSYTITLKEGINLDHISSASVIISGTDPASATLTASPTSGSAPLSVTFTSPWGIGVNAQGMQMVGSGTWIEFGDGSQQSLYCPPSNTICSTPVTVTHTYSQAGTYTASVKSQCACLNATPTTLGTATVTVTGGSSSGIPSISGLSAPTSLTVGQSGTWTVSATSPAGGNLSYGVVWGDEVNTTSSAQAASAPATVASTGSFTHTYQTAGTYTPKFTVSNSSGSAQTSSTVVVSGVSGSATNAATQVLLAALTIEKSYGNVALNIENTLTTAPSCPSSQQFSTTATANAQASYVATVTLMQLLSTVSNDSSAGAQSLALQQFNSLVAQHQVHTQSDLNAEVSTQASVTQYAATCAAGTSSGIPSSVQTQYDSLVPTYGSSLGVFMSQCVKSGNTVYTVTGSGGFSGITYYFDGTGRVLGSVSFSDVPPYLSGVAPVDTSSYQCTQMKSSKS